MKDAYDYPVHPLAEMLPMMGDKDYSQLELSMQLRGWAKDDPSTLYDGQLLDGRNRMRAAKKLAIAPNVVDRTDEIEDPAEFVCRRNFWRRHLTASQKAAVAVRMMPELMSAGLQRMASGGRSERSGKVATPSRSRERAAELCGVSARMVQSANDLPPEMVERVIAGELTVGRARKEAGIGGSAESESAGPTIEEQINRLVDGMDDFDLASIVTHLRLKVGGGKKKGDTDSWCTPKEVRDPVHAFWPEGIDLDPFSNGHSIMDARVSWTKADDAFKKDWQVDGFEHIWLNPIYSDPGPGMERLTDTIAEAGGEGLCLPKGDWSTEWWRLYVEERASAICYWRKRLSFLSEGAAQTTANFPTALVYYGVNPDRFCDHFEEYGDVRGLREVSL